jgi:hypothetical protein
MRRSVVILALVLAVTAVVVPVQAVSGFSDIGDCTGYGYNTFASEQFSIGTMEWVSDCARLKVQGKYWSESTGVVTSSVYYSSSQIHKTWYNVQTTYWSQHWVCDPSVSTCNVWSW